MASLHCEQRVVNELLGFFGAPAEQLLERCGEAVDLTLHGNKSLLAYRQPNPFMAQLDQVLHGHPHRSVVVGRDEWRRDLLVEAVDEYEWDATFGQLFVATGVRVGVGVEARYENNAGHALPDQHLDQSVLGGSPCRLRAQHWRVSASTECLFDDLG